MLDPNIPLRAEDYYHGTEVTSIIVDGPRENPDLDDGCGRFRVRHFGVATSGPFSSFTILRLIRSIVASNRDIKLWNLSLGSTKEVNPSFVSPEAAELDRIQREYDVLFVVAGTNRPEGETTVVRNVHVEDGELRNIELSLYMSRMQNDKELAWNWLLEEFNQPTVEVASAPKAVVHIETRENIVYAATFGHFFFLVDKYCDRDFGFLFARKLAYKEIKTATLTTPSSRRNKTVNTYVNYSELEFDSGESFAKLKAAADLPAEFLLYKPSIEIASSIKFSTNQESLETILDLIVHVENVLRTQEDRCQIPVFSKVSDSILIQRLNDRLTESICRDPAQVNIAELDIVGTAEIFNHNDCEFDLKYRRHERHCQSLSNDTIRDFCAQFALSYADVVLDISVVSYCNGTPVVTKKVKDLIDYADDEERCILSKGVWYKYNTDYLNYLRDSLGEIKAEYHPEYDFNGAIHDAFIDEQYLTEMNDPQYADKSVNEVKQLLKNRYYAERAFNLIRAQQDGFTNFDREPKRIGNATVEQMDLYKDGFMCSVKLGNSFVTLTKGL